MLARETSAIKFQKSRSSLSLRKSLEAKFQVQVSQQEEILWATCSSSIF